MLSCQAMHPKNSYEYEKGIWWMSYVERFLGKASVKSSDVSGVNDAADMAEGSRIR